MKRFLQLFVIFALVIGLSTSMFAQQPTAAELFDQCGAVCDSMASTFAIGSEKRAMSFSVTSAPVIEAKQLALLRTPGQIVGTSVQVSLDILADFDRPVWIAGRVIAATDGQVISRPFYAGRGLAMTRFGSGYFSALEAGGVIPLGEVAVGNAGDGVVLQVVIYDAKNGGRPLQVLSTRMWSRLRPSGETSRVEITETNLKGGFIRLVGRFPVGERLTLEVGDAEWDSGVVEAFAYDPHEIIVKVPSGKTGGPLYPLGWAAVSEWGVTVLAKDGESFSFPRVIRVAGQ